MATPITIQPLVSETDKLLKIVYGPAIEEQQNHTPAMYKRFKRSTKHFGGLHYEFPARMGSAQSIGNRDERTDLPDPQRSTEVPCRVRHKYWFGTGDITGPDLLKGRGNPNAFVDLQTDRMEDLTRMGLKDLNFQFYLIGDGTYAQLIDTTQTGCDVTSVKYLRANRYYDIVDTSVANQIVQAKVLCTKVEVASGVPQVDWGVPLVGNPAVVGGGIPNGDRIVPYSGKTYTFPTGAQPVGIFFHGLEAIVDDGKNLSAFQEINRASNPLWNAKVLDNGGLARPLTLQLMQLAYDLPEMASGHKITLILTSYNGRNLYQNLLVAQKRFNDGNLDGGYESLDFNGKKLLVDVDCPDDKMYFLNEDSIEHFGLFDMKFDDTDGRVLRQSYGANGHARDVFQWTLKLYGNFGATRCNTHSKIIDLEVDTNYKLAA